MSKPMVSYDSGDMIAELAAYLGTNQKNNTLWALIMDVGGSDIIIDWNESIDGLKLSNNETAKAYKDSEVSF